MSRPRFSPRFAPLAGLFMAAALGLFITVLPHPAAAQQSQDVTATASLSDTDVELGQPVTYQIQINGGQPERVPPAPRVEGLEISLVDNSTQMQLSNVSGGGFRLVSSSTYTYSVQARRPGRYVIPGQDVVLRSRTIHLQTVELNVGGNGAAPGQGGNGLNARRNPDVAAFVRIVPAKKTAFVGETIPVEVRIYLGVRLNFQSEPNVTVEGDGFSTQKFTRPQQLDTDVLDGVEYNVIKVKTSITALKTGELTLSPHAQLIIQRPAPPQQHPARDIYGRIYNDPFAPLMMSNEELGGDDLKIEARPLPPGAPEDFDGAIGQFKLGVTAQGNPRKIKAGDPVTLLAALQGQGNFDRIAAPAFADDTGFQIYPANAKFQGDDDVRFRGTKTFEQVVIPRGPRDSLPGYHFSYLDPNTGKYVHLESPALPIRVEGTVPATPAPAAGPGRVAAAAATPSPPAAPTPVPRAEDILYIRNDPGRTLDGESFAPLFRRPVFWLAQLAPLAALAALAAWARLNARARDERRRRATELQRLENELARTLQGEQTGRREFYTAATRLAQLKATRAAGSEDRNLSAREVSQAKGLDADTASSLEAIFHRYDELSYGGERAAQEPVPLHERKDVLATVEKI